VLDSLLFQVHKNYEIFEKKIF
jgi:hypothetical protein